MRLSEFIKQNRESILVEWEAFARTCAPASDPLDVEGLRDHASEMLSVIALDLDTPQGTHEQAEKSKGQAPDGDEGKTAAELHGADRAESGFTVEQMVSEYRALRASVIRLWTKSEGALALEDLEDLTRFNEAIDQSLAESVTRFTTDLDQSKEMFLAILGHDLRTPLGAVTTAAKFMLETHELAEPHLTLTARIASSSSRMNNMVGDLLDFTRSRLGAGIPIVRTSLDMVNVVKAVVDEVVAAHRGRVVNLNAGAPQAGEWDCPRMSQAFTNLLTNAIDYGTEGGVVGVTVGGDAEEVTVAVHNRGTIPNDELKGIFQPMKRKETPGNSSVAPNANLGLGLYIADRIVNAHHGKVEVTSSDADGTTFTVRVPRHGLPT